MNNTLAIIGWGTVAAGILVGVFALLLPVAYPFIGHLILDFRQK